MQRKTTPSALSTASWIATRIPNHGMPMINRFSENGPVGVLKPCCITAGVHTRALTAPHPIKPTSRRCLSLLGSLTPADAPLIDVPDSGHAVPSIQGDNEQTSTPEPHTSFQGEAALAAIKGEDAVRTGAAVRRPPPSDHAVEGRSFRKGPPGVQPWCTRAATPTADVKSLHVKIGELTLGERFFGRSAQQHIRALTVRHPIKPTSPSCPSAWQPNPADAPLSDAENLFR